MSYNPQEVNGLKQEILSLIANGVTDLTDIAATMSIPLPAVEELIRILVSDKKISLRKNT